MNRLDKMQLLCKKLSDYYVEGHVIWYQDMPTMSDIIFIDNLGLRYKYVISIDMLCKDSWMEDTIDDILDDYRLWLINHFFKEP